MTATAHCIRCDWTTGPAPWPAADHAADRHTRTGHPTAVIAEPARRAL